MAEQNKQAVRELWRAVGDGDFDAIAACYGQEVVYHGGSGEYRGIDQLLDYYRAYLAAFPDFRGEVVQAVAEGDLVAHRSRVTGTNTGPFMGAPATGRPVDVTGMILSRLEGGRIVEEWESFDQLELLKQLGAG